MEGERQKLILTTTDDEDNNTVQNDTAGREGGQRPLALLLLIHNDAAPTTSVTTQLNGACGAKIYYHCKITLQKLLTPLYETEPIERNDDKNGIKLLPCS